MRSVCFLITVRTSEVKKLLVRGVGGQVNNISDRVTLFFVFFSYFLFYVQFPLYSLCFLLLSGLMCYLSHDSFAAEMDLSSLEILRKLSENVVIS